MGFFAISAQHIWLNLQFSPAVFFILTIIFILVSNAEKIWQNIVLNSLSFLLFLSLPASYFSFFFASLFPFHFPLPSYSLSFLFPSCSLPSLAASHFIVPTLLAQFLLTFLPPSPPSFLLPSLLSYLLIFLPFFLPPSLPSLLPVFHRFLLPFKRPSIPPSLPFFIFLFLASLTCN